MPSLKHQISPFSRELTVLLVEDDAASRRLLTAQLKGVFAEVILAPDGAEGLALFQRRSPDLVLTDDQMPTMSGITMTEEIRKLDAKVPIIFITASMDTALLVRAINLRISAFVPKPVSSDSLGQAVTLVVSILEHDRLQQKNVEQELALLQLRERYHEVQQELAFRKELSILRNDCLHRSFVGPPGSDRGEWLAEVAYLPHDIMCGDSFSIRKLPDGSLLFFIADAMGKGLAASLTTSLSVYAFNLQVDALDGKAPFDFETFTRAYLSLLSQRLLEDEVFSLCLGWLPHSGATLETAIFGMPPLLIGSPGASVRKIGSNNPPVSAYTEEVRVGAHDLGSARSILVYTDGLNESMAGEDLYRDHLEADFLGCGSGRQLEMAFRSRVARPGDDVTFLFLNRVDADPAWAESIELPSRLQSIEGASEAIEDRLATCTGLQEAPRLELCMAIREALLNAYEHGSLGITTELKRRLLEEDGYFEYLLEREAVVHRSIQVRLSLQAEGGHHLVKVVIQDEGPGFAPPSPRFEDPGSLKVNGRGLIMVGKYTDAYYFNERGNAITLLKRYQGGSHAPGTHGNE